MREFKLQMLAVSIMAVGILLGGSACVNAEQLSPGINMPFDKVNMEGTPKGNTIVKGIIGNAMRFDGTPDCGVTVPQVGFSAPATVSAWVKVGCPRIDYRLISRLDSDKDQVGTIRFHGCHVQAWDGNAWKELVPFIAVNGSWQHLTVVFKVDGTATGYVNGKEKKIVSCSFDFKDTKFGVGTAFKATSGSAFAGDLDEFRVYNKALSANEIKRLYSAKLFNRAESQDGTAVTRLGKAAIKESVEPVRPGIPGARPFWNSHSRRFIYAPAFDFKPVSGAQSYRFNVICSDGSTAQFEADTPYAALSPVWTKMTAGSISLKVEGLDKSGAVLGIAGTRDFVKSQPFNGPYPQRACGYTECATGSLEAQFHGDKFQSVLKTGEPDYNFVFPCKFMGAMTSGMTYYAKFAPKSGNADDAMKMARLSADFLIKLTEKEGTPLAGWPPTYWNGWPLDDPKYTHQKIMTLYPAEGAMAYLDLYDATRDEKYMNAALTIADTYLRLRLKSGTWYQILDSVTGEPAAPNLLVPTYVIQFFDRLKNSYGITKYEEARERAFNWIMANAMRTYNWQGQFEDVGAKLPYEDQSNPDVTGVAIILFKESGKHPEYLAMAKEMLRFAEDQFVVWDRRDAVAGVNWAIPSALEQYVCYTAINASNCALIRAFIAGYEATGDPMYKAKALALADTLTVVWKDFGSKEIPTWMNYGEPSNDWMNCSVVSAMTLIECEKLK
ncbi:MAG: LamG domain-containing protein [Armatimonadota bacterium]